MTLTSYRDGLRSKVPGCRSYQDALQGKQWGSFLDLFVEPGEGMSKFKKKWEKKVVVIEQGKKSNESSLILKSVGSCHFVLPLDKPISLMPLSFTLPTEQSLVNWFDSIPRWSYSYSYLAIWKKPTVWIICDRFSPFAASTAWLLLQCLLVTNRNSLGLINVSAVTTLKSHPE